MVIMLSAGLLGGCGLIGRAAASAGISSVSGAPAAQSGSRKSGTDSTKKADDSLTQPVVNEMFLPSSFQAIVTSDLHYTKNRRANSSIVSGMAFAEEITDALVKEVVDRKPDVFIMTGDNTNTGDIYDASALVKKLRKIQDAGVRIILTTGNHDFNRMDADDFEAAYFDLLEPQDRDPASLSYTVVEKDVVFLAMDDNAVHPGGQGEFSPETMQWLKEMLEKYKGHPVIFLSHHTVIYGKGAKNTAPYRIQNEELLPLLQTYGVQLALTGHMHSQVILEDGGMYEIVSSMPFGGSHTIGDLRINGRDVVYQIQPIELDKYGAGSTAQRLAARDAENSESFLDAIAEVMKKDGVRRSDKEWQGIRTLLGSFFQYYYEGSIADHAAELRADPYYNAMLEALWNHNYGPWIKSTVEDTKISSAGLSFKFR